MDREELKKLSTKQLKAKCRDLDLKGYSRLREDELIDLILKSQEDELTEDELTEDESTEDESTEDESTEDESSLVTFKKLIKGPFGFNGEVFKGSTFKLSAEDAKHPKIENAIKGQLIEKK